MRTPLNREPIRTVIRFKDDYSATLILGKDEKTGIVQERDQFFHEGEPCDVAVFDDQGEYVNPSVGLVVIHRVLQTLQYLTIYMRSQGRIQWTLVEMCASTDKPFVSFK